MIFKEVMKLIDSDNYKFLLNSINEVSPIVSQIGINKETPPMTLMNQNLTRMKKANVQIEELDILISNDINSIIAFSSAKIFKYYNSKTKQEYPEGKESNDFDDDDLEISPFYKDFMIGNLIEYYLLKYKPIELGKYLKEIKTPYFKTYEKELKEIYKKLNNDNM